MAKFRKKPVVVEAWMFTVDADMTKAPEWVKEALRTRRMIHRGNRVEIDTLEGVMVAENGSWIVRGVRGELYPVRNDIFRMTYEEVPDDAQ